MSAANANRLKLNATGIAIILRRSTERGNPIILAVMKPKRSKPTAKPVASPKNTDEEAAAPPRIIGGKFRSRRLNFSPNVRTRPMKERVREAVFNLIGPDVVGSHAIDLFAGTGALGFEAISRGAVGATFVDRHFPTADLIRQSGKSLGIAELTTIFPANVLLWSRRMPPLPSNPWIVFCSPPWDLYVEEPESVLSLLRTLIDQAPPASHFVVDADARFDLNELPQASEWSVRQYPPAVIAMLQTAARL